jgi:ribonuclease E
MKRMLINATQPEEVRVALVDGQKLFDLDIELVGREQKKANIYKGTITRVEPSLEAAFVDYGADRHGFLPLKEISREYFVDKNLRGRPKIKEAINEGQEVIVQIDKEERGNKGAALTTFISLAGCYLVLMPNNPRAGGISRRIEGEEREELRNAMRNVQTPKGMGCIVRTAGVGRNAEELEWDMSVLQNLWTAVKKAAEDRPAPFLIHQESDVIIRALRDYLRSDIGEIIVDKKEIFEKVKRQIQFIRPAFENRVKLNEDRDIPLFNRFQIESQIETAYQREVRLPSGGSIVIDPTEALVSIDINSSRATKGADIEETALQTNKEAAVEIARQLRLRDMGGLVVIDFIDMYPVKNQREVESVLKNALTHDRARVQVGKISRFGLLEMSRQRLKPSLGESAHHVCPRCTGTGVVRGVESLALSILRLLEEEATKDSTTSVQAQLPVEVATFLLNEKRKIILAIEKRQKVHLIIIPNPYMETPNYEIVRMRGSEKLETATFDVPVQPTLEVVTPSANPMINKAEQPAISATEVAIQQAPVHVKKEKEEKAGLLSRIWQALFGSKEKPAPKRKQHSRNSRGGRNDRNRPRNNYRRGRNNKSRDEQTNNRAPKAKQDDERSKRPTRNVSKKPNDSRNETSNDSRNDSKETQQRTRKPRPTRQSREERQKSQQQAQTVETANAVSKPDDNKAVKTKQEAQNSKPTAQSRTVQAQSDQAKSDQTNTDQTNPAQVKPAQTKPAKQTSKAVDEKAPVEKASEENRATETKAPAKKSQTSKTKVVDSAEETSVASSSTAENSVVKQESNEKESTTETKPSKTVTSKPETEQATSSVKTEDNAVQPPVKQDTKTETGSSEVKAQTQSTPAVEDKPAAPVIKAVYKSYAPATKPTAAEAIPALDFEIKMPTFVDGELVTSDVEEPESINKSFSPTTKASAITEN